MGVSASCWTPPSPRPGDERLKRAFDRRGRYDCADGSRAEAPGSADSYAARSGRRLDGRDGVGDAGVDVVGAQGPADGAVRDPVGEFGVYADQVQVAAPVGEFDAEFAGFTRSVAR